MTTNNSNQDTEIIDKYISNDQQQSAVKSPPKPIVTPPQGDDVSSGSDSNLNFTCYNCKKSANVPQHLAQYYLLLETPKSHKYLSYCSSKCFNSDLIPCTVQQSMDHQLLAQTIKQETRMWDLSVHVLIGLINQCIVKGEATYGGGSASSEPELVLRGIYQCHESVYEWLNSFNISYHVLFVEAQWGKGIKRFYMLQGKDADDNLVQEVAEMLAGDSDSDAMTDEEDKASVSVPKESWQILHTVFSNILDKPQIEKVRRLPKDAAKVKKFIVDVPPVMEALNKLGFREQTIEERDYLVWSISGNQENLRQLLGKLKTLQSGGKILRRTDAVPHPHDQFASVQKTVQSSNVTASSGSSSAASAPPATAQKKSEGTTPKKPESSTTTTESDSSVSLREKAKQIRLEKEEKERKRKFEQEKRRRLAGKQAQEAQEQRVAKQREIQQQLEKERKRKEKQADREAKRRLKEQLKRDKEARLAAKREGK